jgi:hypothetical protein
MSSTAVGGSFFINVALAKTEASSFGALPFTERPQTVGLVFQAISERKGWLPFLIGKGLFLEDLTFYLVAGDEAPTTVPPVDTMTQLRSTDATTNLASGCFIIAILPAIATVIQGQTTGPQGQALGSFALLMPQLLRQEKSRNQSWIAPVPVQRREQPVLSCGRNTNQ